MRMLLAAILIGHGAAHVVGFAVPWKLVSSTEVPYRTTVREALVLVGLSLVLCVLHLPESRPGLVTNAGLVANALVLALLIAGGVWGWFANAAIGPAGL